MIKKFLCGFLLLIPVVGFALANPASVNCVERQHQLLLIQQTGICVFADNSYCEEWSYFRHVCKSGTHYWPEAKIDSKKLDKYCVSKKVKDVSVVVLCKQNK